MGYRAISKMREINNEKYGIPFPCEPQDLRKKKNISNLERECLNFLKDACEDLRFDRQKEDLLDRSGKSIGENQIPYNMEMDIDRICLEKAIHRFMLSGTAKDAFDIYFCYIEMFVGTYGASRKMVEMLADFENNASVLLMKHRDHYSHSVYVFLIGLALFQKNKYIKEAYSNYYHLQNEKEAAHHYLKYWGLTALFHDIGYPFEIPFEQVKAYFGNTIKQVPFVAYKGLDEYIKLSAEEIVSFEKLLGRRLEKGDLNEVIAVSIADKLEAVYGENAQWLRQEVLDKKPGSPDVFNGFMDHAYFSGIILLRQLMESVRVENITMCDLDAIAAIVLHNSMYKFSITNIKDTKVNKPFAMELQPLAYILMLCDELQCWDRTSYGQNSRKELHAMWCDFELDEESIKANYYYDVNLEYKKEYAKGTYQKMTGEKCVFVEDIESIIKINQENTPKFSISVSFIKNNRITQKYASDSNFIHLYNFAVALNGRYSYGNEHNVDVKQLEKDFEKLSLEYKLSNILQAKAFAGYLDKIGCFYTDRPVEYELLESFTDKQMDIIGPLEHTRWMEEKKSMGWTYGEAYLDKDLLIKCGVLEENVKAESKRLREVTRTHCLMIEDYEELAIEEQNKDTEPMNCMLKLIEEYDGLRIYRMF